jgi:D-3-phosphoglycerate dehydrogenase
LRVVIADPDIDIDTAKHVLAGTGAEPEFQRDHWTGDDIAAIIVSPEGEVRSSDLDRCPNLKIVVTTSTGADNLDQEECERRHVAVWHPTDYSSDEVADTSIALLLGLLRGTVFLDRSVRDGQWHFGAAGPLKRIDETRLGILGFGKIGQKVANRALALNMTVATYDPLITADAAATVGVKLVGLNELFEGSTAVTVHVPLNDSTHRLVSKERIALMPRGSILANLARGESVDTDAVLDALTSGQLFGAALDVLSKEPPTKEFPAPRHPRLVVTPHAGWYSERSARILFLRPLEIVRDALLAG